MFGRFGGEIFRGRGGRFTTPEGVTSFAQEQLARQEEREAILEDERMRHEDLEAALDWAARPIQERYALDFARLAQRREGAPVVLSNEDMDAIFRDLGLESEVAADRAPTIRIASSIAQSLNAGLPIQVPARDLRMIQDPRVRDRLAGYVNVIAQQAGRQMGRGAFRAVVPPPLRAALGPAGEQLAGQAGAAVAPAAVNIVQRLAGIAGRYVDPALGAALVAALPAAHWLISEDRLSAAGRAIIDWFQSIVGTAGAGAGVDMTDHVERKTVADAVAGFFDNNLESLGEIGEARRVLEAIGEKTTQLHRDKVFLGLAWSLVRDRLAVSAFSRSRGKTPRELAIAGSLTPATPRGVGVRITPGY
jgi:hypothetical protein